jgi:AcrR family transcriptional regulator
MPRNDRPGLGLRERKRIKTLVTIQAEALRLFRLNGYETTTIVEIAAAAEVSESTFFRYFPTKEDVVLLDDLDPIFIETLRDQPRDLTTIEAIRRAMSALFAELSDTERARHHERIALILAVPELRARMFDRLFQGTALIAGLVAEREQTSPDALAARALAGAIIGAGVAALLNLDSDPGADLAETMDRTLLHLQRGFGA